MLPKDLLRFMDYAENPDKAEQLYLISGVNCLPELAYEQMMENKRRYCKSAYELAKEADPSVGTVQEWLASLRGEPGTKGNKGDKGDTGAKGDVGAKGEKGDKGDTGAAGKDGLVYIHANALGTTKLYISHIYVSSFSDLRAADCIEVCEITVQKPDNDTNIEEDLAEAVIMPYLYDYLGAESDYDQVSEPLFFVLEVMAKGIFGTAEFRISEAVRDADLGLDGGRAIIHEMVMNELLRVDSAGDVFLEEFADFMAVWSDYADDLGENYAFGKKEACIVGAIGNLSDNEFIILLDGVGESDSYKEYENVKKAWQIMVESGLSEEIKNNEKMDAYRHMSKKFSNSSLKFFQYAGKALSQLGDVVNLAEQYGSYLLLASMQDEVDVLIDSWIAATDNAELIAELEAYKEVYSSAGGIVFNAFADADLVPGLLTEAAKNFGGKIISEIAKKGALGAAMKKWIESKAEHTIIKAISSADSYIMISNTIAKYMLGVDADAVYTAINNLLVIDPIYRELIEEICDYGEDYYIHDSYINKVKLAAALAQLEYKYCIDIFENDMAIPFNDKKDTIQQVIDMYTEYSNTITETLDGFIEQIYELREQ